MRASNTRSIHLIAHNVRSAYNVGSMIRTAAALDATGILLSGYSPYPLQPQDSRLPHVAARVTSRIAKTSLGAESTLPSRHYGSLAEAIAGLRLVVPSIKIYALEQIKTARSLVGVFDDSDVSAAAIVVGNEITGLKKDDLVLADLVVEVPMIGSKESLNVSTAAAIALYELQRTRLRNTDFAP